MTTEPIIKVSVEEEAYRIKHFNVIRVIKPRHLVCGSCGNEINKVFGKVFSHPVIGILQCKTCWQQFNGICWESDRDNILLHKHCCICGQKKNTYSCKNKNCTFLFCRACIKRNVNLSLLNVETQDWKCFACVSKPFWELRAVCASVMASLFKRNRKAGFHEIAPHKRHASAKTRLLQENLKTFCDSEDSSNSLEERPLFLLKSTDKSDSSGPSKNARKKCTFKNNKKEANKNQSYTMDSSVNKETCNLSSDEVRTQKIKRIKSKSRQVSKSTASSSEEETELSTAKNFSRKGRMSHAAKEEFCDRSSNISKRQTLKLPESDTSSKSRNKEKISVDAELWDNENDQDDSDTVSKPSNGRTGRDQKKSNEEEEKYNVYFESSSEDTEVTKPRTNKSSSNSHKKRRHSVGNTEVEYRRCLKKRYDDSNVCKNQSDSTSGPEFQKVKLSRKLHGSLSKLSVEKDDKSSKQLSSYFKSSTANILDSFKESCCKYDLYMDHLKKKYLKKELISLEHADNFLLKSRAIINKLKLELDKQQKELMLFRRAWQKECDYNSSRQLTEVNSKEKSSSEDEEVAKDNCDENSNKSRTRRSSSTNLVSDCDSEEIFSSSEDKVKKPDNAANLTSNEADEERSFANIIREDISGSDKQLASSQSPILGSSKEKKYAIQRDNVLSMKRLSTKQATTEKAGCSSSSIKEVVLDSDEKSHLTQTSDAKGKENTTRIACMESSDTSEVPVTNSVADDGNNEIHDSMEDMFETTSNFGSEVGTGVNDSQTTDILQDQDNISDLMLNRSEHGNIHKKEKQKNKLNNEQDLIAIKENSSKHMQNIRIESKKQADDTRDDTPVLEDKQLQILKKECISETKKRTCSSLLAESDIGTKSKETDSSLPEMPMNEENATQYSEDTSNMNINSSSETLLLSDTKNDKDTLYVMENKSKVPKKIKERISSGSASSASEQDSGKVEETAKLVLLEDSDDSISLSHESIKTKNEKMESDDNSDNFKAKNALLRSSNSESSDSDCNLDRDTNSLEININNSKLSKHRREPESDISVGMRVKKRRLNLHKNRYYMSDKKLQMECRVTLERLPQKVLNRYARALYKSRQHLEHKSIKSLINLENLEKNRTKGGEHNSNTAKGSCLLSPSLKNQHKKKLEIENEESESLMDHLKRVENGEILEDEDKDANYEELNESAESVSLAVTNKDLLSEADAFAKNILLNSSGSEAEQESALDKSDEDGEDTNAKKNKVASNKDKDQSSKKNTTEDKEESAKSRWKRNKILTVTFSDTDSEAEKKKFDIKQEKLQAKMEEDDDDEFQKEVIIKKSRKKTGRRIIDSDSDILLTDVDSDSDKSAVISDKKESSDSDIDTRKRKKRLRKTNKSSESDSSSTEKKPKPKRKRIKKMPSDSNSDKDSDGVTSSQGTPGKSGRKNIRKLIKDKQVTEDTKQAAKEEEERLKRIADRQKLYNEMYEIRLAGEKKVDKLVLDFDTETKEELISVHKDLVKRLKPHQAQGIKFMWDACFESLERIKTTRGSGCIIAHCMGLGKTLQVISLIHTLLSHESTGVRTVMVVSPLSTVLNWVNELNMWLEGIDTVEVEVYELTKFKKNFERKYQLQQWQKTGGVLIIGYEMFRNLTGENKKMRKNMKEALLRCLIDPGPDLIVCDEGHLLKNEGTALSKCMNRVKTLRRIVLTGTPLQNNLIEYHCMVQFVKPNLLGTKKEFLNRFVNPITNGQFDDSTAHDVKIMKKRAHVLHKMLEGCVQRFDYSVLMPFLPPKQEYVIFVRLTDAQIKMYQHYLDNFARRSRGAGGSLFADFQALQRIWTHPIILRLNAEKMEKANERKRSSSDSEGSLKDFIDDETNTDSETTRSSSDDDVQSVHDSGEKPKPMRATRSTPLTKEDTPEPVVNAEDREWWSEFVQPEHFENIKTSAKLILLFGILKESEQIGDKVLVFSQSLYSLTLIEHFLSRIDDETQAGTASEYIEGHNGSWTLGLDYFRLDGQTSAENRNAWCKIFNRPKNTRARLFLISTRAGGLGINLTAANRVIIFDASWNPSHDVQSIFRIYRFGQKKPCYVYRFLAFGTMEEKIYNRQVTKLSLSCRVVDEQQIERHYSNNDLNELYKFEPHTEGERPTLNLPKDRLLAEIFLKYKDFVENYHEHDSLLENKAEEELDEEERKQAWLEYEEEKKGKPQQMYPMMTQYQKNMLLNQYNMMGQSALAAQSPSMQIDYENLQQLIRKDYPNATLEQQKMMTANALMEMYNYWEQQAILQPARNAMIPQRRVGGLMPGVNINPMGYNPQAQQIQVRPQIQVDQHAKHKQQVFNQPTTSTSMRDTHLKSNIDNNTTMNTSGGADDDVVEVTTNSISIIPLTTQSTPQQENSNKAQEE